MFIYRGARSSTEKDVYQVVQLASRQGEYAPRRYVSGSARWNTSYQTARDSFWRTPRTNMQKSWFSVKSDLAHSLMLISVFLVRYGKTSNAFFH